MATMSDDSVEDEHALTPRKNLPQDTAYSSQQECDIIPDASEKSIDSEAKSFEPTNGQCIVGHSTESEHDNYHDIPAEVLNPEVLLTSDSELHDTCSSLHCKYPQCDFKTSSSSAFLKHESSHDNTHPAGRSYQCDICHMKFTLFANMRRHKMSHFGVRPFECRLCSKRFFRKDHLMEHLVRQHSKQRPYRCPFCIKSFSFRQHLKAHLSSDHSGGTHDKTCKICGFKASSVTGAKIHFTTCHVKKSPSLQETNSFEKNTNVVTTAHSCYNGAESTVGVDLGTVSQNFSFVPPHYRPVSITTSNLAHVEGPSSVSFCLPGMTHTSSPQIPFISCRQASSQMVPVTPSPACSTSSPTTTVSPSVARTNLISHVSSISYDTNGYASKTGVKLEPPDIVVDDSENSTVHPTSTMELTADQIETSYTPHDTDGQESHPSEEKHSICSQRDSDSWPSGSLPHGSVNSDCHHSQPHDSSRSSNAPIPFTSDHPNSNWNIWSESKNFKDTKMFRPSRSHCSNSCSCLHHSNSEKCGKLNSNSQKICCDDVKVLSGRKRHHSETILPENRLMPIREPGPLALRNTSNVEDMDTSLPLANCCQSSATPQQTKRHVDTKRHMESIYGDDDEEEDEEQSSSGFKSYLACPYCGIVFPDQTLYFLHRSLHTDASPWKCNLCGKQCRDKYDFNAHIISQAHH